MVQPIVRLPSSSLPTRADKTPAVPQNVIFKHLQAGTRVVIWLYDNIEQRIEGKIIGFDEFMNVVLDDSEEVWIKASKGKTVGSRNALGRLLLKGENITLIAPVLTA